MVLVIFRTLGCLSSVLEIAIFISKGPQVAGVFPFDDVHECNDSNAAIVIIMSESYAL